MGILARSWQAGLNIRKGVCQTSHSAAAGGYGSWEKDSRSLWELTSSSQEKLGVGSVWVSYWAA